VQLRETAHDDHDTVMCVGHNQGWSEVSIPPSFCHIVALHLLLQGSLSLHACPDCCVAVENGVALHYAILHAIVWLCLETLWEGDASPLQRCVGRVVTADSHQCAACMQAATAFSNIHVKLTTSTAALLQTEADSWNAATEEENTWDLVGVVTAEGGLESLQDLAALSDH
jgi:hypothetical protein